MDKLKKDEEVAEVWNSGPMIKAISSLLVEIINENKTESNI